MSRALRALATNPRALSGVTQACIALVELSWLNSMDRGLVGGVHKHLRMEGSKMKIIAGPIITLALMTGLPAIGGEKDPAAGVPQYNVKTEVDFKGIIVKVREVPAGEAYAGIHLTIQSKSDAVEVFLAPADFVKLMRVQLNVGEKNVGVTGSKVKFEGEELVLARELRIENMVLTLRDEKGFPTWLWLTRTDFTSGF